METKRRKTKWSFHLFKIGEEKIMPRHELPLFRSSLSVWNKANPTDYIYYDHNISSKNVIVTRISGPTDQEAIEAIRNQLNYLGHDGR